MYGLIARVSAISGIRDELASISFEGVGAMPGNLSFILASDLTDPDRLRVTEACSGREWVAHSI